MGYKGYLGNVEFSEEDEMFFGKGLGIRSLISYEGDNVKALIFAIHDVVDEYLRLCEDWRTLDYEISEISRKSQRIYWKGLNTNGK